MLAYIKATWREWIVAIVLSYIAGAAGALTIYAIAG